MALDQTIKERVGDLSLMYDEPVQRLNLNLLYPLDAVLHAPTLTAAGRRVNLAQSTISHALRRLRTHFDDDLVIVMSGELRLTTLGLALRDPVRKVVRDVENTLRLSVNFDPLTTKETITIAATETAEGMLLVPIIRSLSTIAPNLNVSIVPFHRRSFSQLVDIGVDLFVVPEEMAIDDMEIMPIIGDTASCMIWTGHQALGESLEVTEEQYLGSRHIVANGELPESLSIDPSGLTLLRNRDITVRTASLAMIPGIIVGSDLIATGSSWLFQYYASYMPLKVIPAPFVRRQSTIVAQWPTHRQGPKLVWFLDQIKTYYRRHYPL